VRVSARTLRGVTDTQSPAPSTEAPRSILVAWVALLVAAAFAVITAASLFGARSYLKTSATKSLNDDIANIRKKAITASYTQAQQNADLAKKQQSINDLPHSISNYLTSQLVTSLILAVLLVFIALRVRDGRHWTRWVVVAVWLLLSLFGLSLIGLLPALSAVTLYPVIVKIPVLIGALAFVVAVVAINMRPSVAFLNANRPARVEGAAAPGLRGLFAPRGIAGRPAAPAKPARPAARATEPAAVRPAPPDVPKTTKAKARAAAVPPPPPAKTRGKSRGR
jgi:hypothetical protein